MSSIFNDINKVVDYLHTCYRGKCFLQLKSLIYPFTALSCFSKMASSSVLLLRLGQIVVFKTIHTSKMISPALATLLNG